MSAAGGGRSPRRDGAEMFGWLRRRRSRAELIEAVAEAVIRACAIEAYAEARRRLDR